MNDLELPDDLYAPDFEHEDASIYDIIEELESLVRSD